MSSRIGVLGGTFDPPHLAHLLAASEAAAALELDEVVFVPTGRPWQKAAVPVTDPALRLEMTRLAVRGDPRFSVSSVDVDRPGATYTVDTLRDLQRDRTGCSWFFLAGADAVASLPSWKDAAELLRLATVVGLTRPGHRLDVDALPDPLAGQVVVVPMPALEISSSDCRARVRTGRPLSYLVPGQVVSYIEAERLYLEAGEELGGA